MDRIEHWYHAYVVNDWEDIVSDHLESLQVSGLARQIGTLHLGVVGAPHARKALIALCSRWMPVAVVAEEDVGWEQVTLEALRQRCTRPFILYAHTKGVSRPALSNEALESNWRLELSSRLIGDWQHCVRLLKDHEAVGCQWISHKRVDRYCNDPGVPLFGGNWWWARKSLIDRLGPPRLTSRYDAELWFGLNGPVDAYDVGRDLVIDEHELAWA